MSLWDTLVGVRDELLEAAARRLELRLPTDPIPAEWLAIVRRNVPLAAGLDAAHRDRLLHIAQLFLREVPMEGCADLELTDEMRVTVAVTASLLLLELPYPRFTKLLRVLVYPDTFVPVRVRSHRDGGVHQSDVPTLGQAWIDGMVVVSWEAVLHDAAHPEKGGNVVLHEFAHILDGEDGVFDGTPVLENRSPGEEWARVLSEEFDRQRDAARTGADAALDYYAATNRAEFFAVATEAFFADPDRLRSRLPALYEQLARCYGRDLASAENAHR